MNLIGALSLGRVKIRVVNPCCPPFFRLISLCQIACSEAGCVETRPRTTSCAEPIFWSAASSRRFVTHRLVDGLSLSATSRLEEKR
jgi:hypothetical protein